MRKIFVVLVMLGFSTVGWAQGNISAADKIMPIKDEEFVLDGKSYSKADIIRDFLEVAFSETFWNSDSVDYKYFFRDFIRDFEKITVTPAEANIKPWLSDAKFRSEEFPREGGINRWNKEEIKIAVGWPQSTAPRSSIIIGIVALVLFSIGNLFTGFESPFFKRYATYDRIEANAQGVNRAAKRALADGYATGFGVKKNLEKAAYWYENAHNETEDKSSAYYAALAYEELGNQAKAQEWYIKAADYKNDWALQKLGRLQIEENAADEETVVAACDKSSFDEKLCRDAAIKGYTNAQISYADYLAVKGNNEDNKLSAGFWYEQAARSGSWSAIKIIGDSYLRGQFSRMDLKKAASWHAKMAEAYSFYRAHANIIEYAAPP